MKGRSSCGAVPAKPPLADAQMAPTRTWPAKTSTARKPRPAATAIGPCLSPAVPLRFPAPQHSREIRRDHAARARAASAACWDCRRDRAARRSGTWLRASSVRTRRGRQRGRAPPRHRPFSASARMLRPKAAPMTAATSVWLNDPGVALAQATNAAPPPLLGTPQNFIPPLPSVPNTTPPFQGHDVVQLAGGKLSNPLRHSRAADDPGTGTLNATGNAACVMGCTSSQLGCQTSCSLLSSQIGR